MFPIFLDVDFFCCSVSCQRQRQGRLLLGLRAGKAACWPKTHEPVNDRYPLVMTNIAIENGHGNSVSFQTDLMIFHSLYYTWAKGDETN